jgi:hypothetical protein
MLTVNIFTRFGAQPPPCFLDPRTEWGDTGIRDHQILTLRQCLTLTFRLRLKNRRVAKKRRWPTNFMALEGVGRRTSFVVGADMTLLRRAFAG